jgi:hypothetical protein
MYKKDNNTNKSETYSNDMSLKPLDERIIIHKEFAAKYSASLLSYAKQFHSTSGRGAIAIIEDNLAKSHSENGADHTEVGLVYLKRDADSIFSDPNARVKFIKMVEGYEPEWMFVMAVFSNCGVSLYSIGAPIYSMRN